MTDTNIAFPTPIRFGAGRHRELPALLAGLGITKPLLVTDPGLRATAAFADVTAVLTNFTVCDSVHPNPVEDDVKAVAAAYIENGCDGVIGLGGGSALDTAKIARWLAVHADLGLAGFSWEHVYEKLPPFVAIPTTAGTGSEVGRSSVVTLDGHKRVFFHPRLLADLVILDPVLTTGLPPRLTAATGADAFVHCLESLTSPVFHPFCDGIAWEGLRLAWENLPAAVAEGANLEARGLMLMAAAMGGVAFQKDLGAVHSLSHPLSARFGVHHGTANALCLIPVMTFNAEKKPGVYRRAASALGLTDSSDAAVIAAVKTWLETIGLTGGLRGQNVPETALETLAPDAFADSCHQTNPVPVTEADLLALYRRAW
ncbi:MAG: iron-containing alcohol dehydrogenase [Verrucomicrobiota bacterium]